MSLRMRLVIFVLLFSSAVLTNIFALVYLARSISHSMQEMESIRQRQLVAVQMNAHLRDAEAALYRYQINGEAGFKTQFQEQLENFSQDVQTYRRLAGAEKEQQWASLLDGAHQQIFTTGNSLITLREQQSLTIGKFLDAQAQLASLLQADRIPSRPEDAAYQASVTAMQDASRSMLSAVTGYLASPEENRRGQFTDAVVSFQRAVDAFGTLAESEEETRWRSDTLTQFEALKRLGTRLIGGRDLQESLYANFFSLIFNASQQLIVGQIEPHETERFSQEQRGLLASVWLASVISIFTAVLISGFAIVFMFYLSRQINTRVSALLEAAERVTHGDLSQPAEMQGADEFGILAESFNEMMRELALREDRLRALIGRMAQIQDEERRLIGLDLHDGLTQLIISANMHLNALNAQIGSKLNAQSLQALDVSRALVKQSIDEARKVISELRPTMIDDLGLERGLRQYVTELCEEQKWQAEVLLDLQGLEIESAAQTAIFRIVQEALSNIRKHAKTQRVRVELRAEEANLRLMVQDWGQGFDASLIRREEAEHLGLVSMQERAEMINGICKIESDLGQGTRVEVTIPRSALARRSRDGR